MMSCQSFVNPSAAPKPVPVNKDALFGRRSRVLMDLIDLGRALTAGKEHFGNCRF